MRRKLLFLPLFAGLLLIVVFGTGLRCILATATHVVDGDTFDIRVDLPLNWGDDCPVIAGQTYRVRLIGVDAPEVGSGCFGQEASAYVKNLVENHEASERGGLRQALLDYCQRDTEAMVRVFDALQSYNETEESDGQT